MTDANNRETALELSQGKMARPLDYTRPLWERQAGETPKGYQEFLNYRDSEPRKVRDHSSGGVRSATWSWPLRVLEWDRLMAQQDADEMIRYRVKMNDRHRTIARLAQGKVATWLQKITEADVMKMKAGDIVRLIEVSAKLERDASRINGEADINIAVGVSGMVETFTQDVTDQRLTDLMSEMQARLNASKDAALDVDVVEAEILDDDGGE